MSKEIFYNILKSAQAKNRESKKQDMHGELYERANKGKQVPLVQGDLTRNSAMLVGEELVVRVQVFSKVMAGRAKRVERAISRHTNLNELRSLFGLMAAAMAEQVSEAFGDDYDAAEFEKMGQECFNQIHHALEAGMLTQGTIYG